MGKGRKGNKSSDSKKQSSGKRKSLTLSATHSAGALTNQLGQLIFFRQLLDANLQPPMIQAIDLTNELEVLANG